MSNQTKVVEQESPLSDQDTELGLHLPPLPFLQQEGLSKKDLTQIGSEITNTLSEEKYLEAYILLTKLQAVISGAKDKMKDYILSEIESGTDKAFGAKLGVSKRTTYAFPDPAIQAKAAALKSLQTLAKNALNAGKIEFIDDEGQVYQSAIITKGSVSPKITL